MSASVTGRDEEDEVMCRICFCEGTPAEPLRTPCACAGSMGLVHSACLLRWVETSRTTHCEICKVRLRFRPLLAADAPPSLPTAELAWEAVVSFFTHWLPFLVFLAVSSFAWLAVIPFVAAVSYRFVVHLPSALAPGTFTDRLTPPRLLEDWAAGVVVIAFIIFCIASNGFIGDLLVGLSRLDDMRRARYASLARQAAARGAAVAPVLVWPCVRRRGGVQAAGAALAPLGVAPPPAAPVAGAVGAVPPAAAGAAGRGVHAAGGFHQAGPGAAPALPPPGLWLRTCFHIAGAVSHMLGVDPIMARVYVHALAPAAAAGVAVAGLLTRGTVRMPLASLTSFAAIIASGSGSNTDNGGAAGVPPPAAIAIVRVGYALVLAALVALLVLRSFSNKRGLTAGARDWVAARRGLALFRARPDGGWPALGRLEAPGVAALEDGAASQVQGAVGAITTVGKALGIVQVVILGALQLTLVAPTSSVGRLVAIAARTPPVAALLTLLTTPTSGAVPAALQQSFNADGSLREETTLLLAVLLWEWTVLLMMLLTPVTGMLGGMVKPNRLVPGAGHAYLAGRAAEVAARAAAAAAPPDEAARGGEEAAGQEQQHQQQPVEADAAPAAPMEQQQQQQQAPPAAPQPPPQQQPLPGFAMAAEADIGGHADGWTELVALRNTLRWGWEDEEEHMDAGAGPGAGALRRRRAPRGGAGGGGGGAGGDRAAAAAAAAAAGIPDVAFDAAGFDDDEEAAAALAAAAAAGDDGGVFGPFFDFLGVREQSYFQLLIHVLSGAVLVLVSTGLFMGLAIVSVRNVGTWSTGRGDNWLIPVLQALIFNFRGIKGSDPLNLQHPSVDEPVMLGSDLVCLLHGYGSLFLFCQIVGLLDWLSLLVCQAYVVVRKGVARASAACSATAATWAALLFYPADVLFSAAAPDVPLAIAGIVPLGRVRGMAESRAYARTAVHVAHASFLFIGRLLVIQPLLIGLVFAASTSPLLSAPLPAPPGAPALSLVQDAFAPGGPAWSTYFPVPWFVSRLLTGLVVQAIVGALIVQWRDTVAHRLLATWTVPLHRRGDQMRRLLIMPLRWHLSSMVCMTTFAAIFCGVFVYLPLKVFESQGFALGPSAPLPPVLLSNGTVLPPAGVASLATPAPGVSEAPVFSSRSYLTAADQHLNFADVTAGTLTVLSLSCVSAVSLGVTAPGGSASGRVANGSSSAAPHLPGSSALPPRCPPGHLMSALVYLHAVSMPMHGVSFSPAATMWSTAYRPLFAYETAAFRPGSNRPGDIDEEEEGTEDNRGRGEEEAGSSAVPRAEGEEPQPAGAEGQTPAAPLPSQAAAAPSASASRKSEANDSIWSVSFLQRLPRITSHFKSGRVLRGLTEAVLFSIEVSDGLVNASIEMIFNLMVGVPHEEEDQAVQPSVGAEEAVEAGGESTAQSPSPSPAALPSPSPAPSSASAGADDSRVHYSPLQESPFFNVTIFEGTREWDVVAPAIWKALAVSRLQLRAGLRTPLGGDCPLPPVHAAVPVGFNAHDFFDGDCKGAVANSNKEVDELVVTAVDASGDIVWAPAPANASSSSTAPMNASVPLDTDDTDGEGSVVNVFLRSMPVFRFVSAAGYSYLNPPEAALAAAAAGGEGGTGRSSRAPVGLSLRQRLLQLKTSLTFLGAEEEADAGRLLAFHDWSVRYVGEMVPRFEPPAEGTGPARIAGGSFRKAVAARLHEMGALPPDVPAGVDEVSRWVVDVDGFASGYSAGATVADGEEEGDDEEGVEELQPPARVLSAFPHVAEAVARQQAAAKAAGAGANASTANATKPRSLTAGSIVLDGPHAGTRVCVLTNTTISEYFKRLAPRSSRVDEGHGGLPDAEAAASAAARRRAAASNGTADEDAHGDADPEDAAAASSAPRRRSSSSPSVRKPRLYHSYRMDTASGYLMDCGITPPPSLSFAALLPPPGAALVAWRALPGVGLRGQAAPLTAPDGGAAQEQANLAQLLASVPSLYALAPLTSIPAPTWGAFLAKKGRGLAAVAANATSACWGVAQAVAGAVSASASAATRAASPLLARPRALLSRLADYGVGTISRWLDFVLPTPLYLTYGPSPWHLVYELLAIQILLALILTHAKEWVLAMQRTIFTNVTAALGLRSILPPKETLSFRVQLWPLKGGSTNPALPPPLVPTSIRADVVSFRHVEGTPLIGKETTAWLHMRPPVLAAETVPGGGVSPEHLLHWAQRLPGAAENPVASALLASAGHARRNARAMQRRSRQHASAELRRSTDPLALLADQYVASAVHPGEFVDDREGLLRAENEAVARFTLDFCGDGVEIVAPYSSGALRLSRRRVLNRADMMSRYTFKYGLRIHTLDLSLLAPRRRLLLATWGRRATSAADLLRELQGAPPVGHNLDAEAASQLALASLAQMRVIDPALVPGFGGPGANGGGGGVNQPGFAPLFPNGDEEEDDGGIDDEDEDEEDGMVEALLERREDEGGDEEEDNGGNDSGEEEEDGEEAGTGLAAHRRRRRRRAGSAASQDEGGDAAPSAVPAPAPAATPELDSLSDVEDAYLTRVKGPGLLLRADRRRLRARDGGGFEPPAGAADEPDDADDDAASTGSREYHESDFMWHVREATAEETGHPVMSVRVLQADRLVGTCGGASAAPVPLDAYFGLPPPPQAAPSAPAPAPSPPRPVLDVPIATDALSAALQERLLLSVAMNHPLCAQACRDARSLYGAFVSDAATPEAAAYLTRLAMDPASATADAAPPPPSSVNPMPPAWSHTIQHTANELQLRDATIPFVTVLSLRGLTAHMASASGEAGSAGGARGSKAARSRASSSATASSAGSRSRRGSALPPVIDMPTLWPTCCTRCGATSDEWGPFTPPHSLAGRPFCSVMCASEWQEAKGGRGAVLPPRPVPASPSVVIRLVPAPQREAGPSALAKAVARLASGLNWAVSTAWAPLTAPTRPLRIAALLILGWFFTIIGYPTWLGWSVRFGRAFLGLLNDILYVSGLSTGSSIVWRHDFTCLLVGASMIFVVADALRISLRALVNAGTGLTRRVAAATLLLSGQVTEAWYADGGSGTAALLRVSGPTAASLASAAATAAARGGTAPTVSPLDLVLAPQYAPGATLWPAALLPLRALAARALLWVTLPLWDWAMRDAFAAGNVYRTPRTMSLRRAAQVVAGVVIAMAVAPVTIGISWLLVSDPLAAVASIASALGGGSAAGGLFAPAALTGDASSAANATVVAAQLPLSSSLCSNGSMTAAAANLPWQTALALLRHAATAAPGTSPAAAAAAAAASTWLSPTSPVYSWWLRGTIWLFFLYTATSSGALGQAHRMELLMVEWRAIAGMISRVWMRKLYPALKVAVVAIAVVLAAFAATGPGLLARAAEVLGAAIPAGSCGSPSLLLLPLAPAGGDAASSAWLPALGALALTAQRAGRLIACSIFGTATAVTAWKLSAPFLRHNGAWYRWAGAALRVPTPWARVWRASELVSALRRWHNRLYLQRYQVGRQVVDYQGRR